MPVREISGNAVASPSLQGALHRSGNFLSIGDPSAAACVGRFCSRAGWDWQKRTSGLANRLREVEGEESPRAFLRSQHSQRRREASGE